MNQNKATSLLEPAAEPGKRAIQAVQIRERLALVGMLSSGAVNQINNPLTQVLASLELAGEILSGVAHRDERLSDLEGLLRRARTDAEKIKALVHDIKVFARETGDIAMMVDVRRHLDSAIAIASRELQNRALLVKEYRDVPPVRAFGGQLTQAFLSVLLNAAQAIPEGAKQQNEIRVSTGVGQSGETIVSITDTGCGIPKDNLVRAFEPFFTTKAAGNVGLGLSITKSVVDACGGRIQLDSDGVNGTKVTMAFPVPTASASLSIGRASGATPKRGRILVIDDEAGIGDLVNVILLKEYEVVSVSGANEGMQLLKGESFDLILCDLMMPEITGIDLYERLRVERPELGKKLIFMTGGIFTLQGQEFLKSSPIRTIEKPFQINSLRQLIRETIGG